MTTLADMAARVRQVRQRHGERAEQLATKAAEITKRGEQAIEQMEKIVAEQEVDVAALETELRLTNGGPA